MTLWPEAYAMAAVSEAGHVSQAWLQALVMLLVIGMLISICRLAYLDYHAFVALGPGGTPSTVRGWTKLKFLSLVRLRDPLAPPSIPSTLLRSDGFLSRRTLPTRVGPRPIVAGLAPQRQLDSFASPKTYQETMDAIVQLAVEDNRLGLVLSPFEKHSEALCVLKPVRNFAKGGEVCHVHPSDGSLHLTLHPADVALCIENGWGERHPLARGGWMTRYVPETFVMVYAPRSSLEVQIVMEIINAAVWWISGGDMHDEKALE